MADDEFNEDVGYEKFAQSIYQTLLDNEDIKPTKVQHNVDLLGRSGCKHQIDVYWEYEIAGIIHRVAIECKNYNTSNISIGRVRDFFAALTDIGNISGIFVCKSNYQSGAIKFADFYGINLKFLRVPTDEDWQGRIQTIQINLSSIHFDIKSRLTNFDNDWFKRTYPNPSTNMSFQIKGMNKDILIKDSAGNKITDMFELDNKLPHEWKEERNKEHEYKYTDAYMDIEGLGPVKLLSIKYTYDVLTTDPEVITISGKETAKAILKDVKTGTIKFFDKDGNIK
jgi:hypothetical protein